VCDAYLANRDVLGLPEVEGKASLPPHTQIDPRIHLLGKTEVHIHDGEAPESQLHDLRPYLDEDNKILRASNRQIEHDYGNGILKINAPKVKALGGNLQAAGPTRLGVLSIDSPLEIGHVILVSLDDRPLEHSHNMLLQIMTEERPTGWQSQGTDNLRHRITDIGHDPWTIRIPQGEIRIVRPDAPPLKVTPLDLNGYPREQSFNADRFKLLPDTVYYWVHL
ncbi:MAG: hypothetical protein JJU29_04655, partial [Verrucomicrobia bacterium]|nr:hypothetical protein [Verrucomicrobiota bacterium]